MPNKPTPEERELRERCLELAVKAAPERAVELAAQFIAFVKGDDSATSALGEAV